MVFYNFDGVFQNTTDSVNVDYNETTQEVTAITSVGGMPAIIYDEYLPDIPDGTLLAAFINGPVTAKLYFKRYFPFANVQFEPSDEPVVPVTPLVIDSIIVTNQSAVNINDGTVTVSASGGTSPYTYSIDGVNYQSSNIISGLSPGNYLLTVKDDTGALITQSFVVTAAAYPPTPPVTPIIQDVIALEGANEEIQNAYKRVSVKTVFGKVPSIIYNGDFEFYDGQNWEFWTKFGNINVSRVQRTIKNNAGADVPINDYAIQFNQKANTSRYLEHTAIPVQKGDTVKATYRVGKTIGTGVSQGVLQVSSFSIPATYDVFYEFIMRIKVGDFYLYNPGYGNAYEWVNQLSSVNHKISNPAGDLSNFNISFSIPECPVSGSMTIQLYGFNKIQNITTEEFKINNFGQKIPPQNITNELSEYDPILFDNFEANKTSQSNDNDIDGILNISDNLKYFTQKPEPIEILFGDYFFRRNATQLLDNLYAINVGENYSAEWYEFGSGNSAVPFGLSLAKGILKSYQEPFRFWSGDVKLKPSTTDFNYLNVFLFNVPNQPSFNRKQFVLLGGDFDLKYNTIENARLAETFSKTPKSNDSTLPSYPDMEDPVFVQDPNATINNGIFTQEFTQEFN